MRAPPHVAVGGTVKGARVTRGGVAIIDFGDLPALATMSTTNGARELLAELAQVVFADSRVVAVEYRLNGSCQKFWTAVQAQCQRIER